MSEPATNHARDTDTSAQIRATTADLHDWAVKQAIVDGFADLPTCIQPPLLNMITHPLTHERGHLCEDVPIVSLDLIDDGDQA